MSAAEMSPEARMAAIRADLRKQEGSFTATSVQKTYTVSYKAAKKIVEEAKNLNDEEDNPKTLLEENESAESMEVEGEECDKMKKTDSSGSADSKKSSKGKTHNPKIAAQAKLVAEKGLGRPTGMSEKEWAAEMLWKQLPHDDPKIQELIKGCGGPEAVKRMIRDKAVDEITKEMGAGSIGMGGAQNVVKSKEEGRAPRNRRGAKKEVLVGV